MPDREEGEEHRIEAYRRSEGIRPAEGDKNDGEITDAQRLRFHYNREERLKKLRTQKTHVQTRKWGRFFADKKSRRLFILLANMALIYMIIFTFVKPSNVFIRQRLEGCDYELNVTALRGKKTLVGFTLRNGKSGDLVFEEPVPVSLLIRGRSGFLITTRKHIERDTVLLPGESTSVVFLFEEADLPRTADLEIFYDDSPEPLFKRTVRF